MKVTGRLTFRYFKVTALYSVILIGPNLTPPLVINDSGYPLGEPMPLIFFLCAVVGDANGNLET